MLELRLTVSARRPLSACIVSTETRAVSYRRIRSCTAESLEDVDSWRTSCSTNARHAARHASFTFVSVHPKVLNHGSSALGTGITRWTCPSVISVRGGKVRIGERLWLLRLLAGRVYRGAGGIAGPSIDHRRKSIHASVYKHHQTLFHPVTPFLPYLQDHSRSQSLYWFPFHA